MILAVMKPIRNLSEQLIITTLRFFMRINVMDDNEGFERLVRLTKTKTI